MLNMVTLLNFLCCRRQLYFLMLLARVFCRYITARSCVANQRPMGPY